MSVTDGGLYYNNLIICRLSYSVNILQFAVPIAYSTMYIVYRRLLYPKRNQESGGLEQKSYFELQKVH